jgi:hypothetical protein
MMILPSYWRYGLALALVVGALLGATWAWAAPGALPTLRVGQEGTGYDPLTPQEIEEAAAQSGVQPLLARTTAQREQAPATLAANWSPSTHEEVLLIERSPEVKGELSAQAWARRADVFTYRYATDTLVHTIYNYATDSVDSVASHQDFQLPLTAYERDVATALAFADPEFRQYAERAYAELTGRPLTDLQALDTRVFVYYAGAAPDVEPAGMEQCGVNRCAQIMVVAKDATVLEVLPLVNLSTGQVAFVEPQAEDGHDHLLDDHTQLDHQHFDQQSNIQAFSEEVQQ